MVSLLLRGKLLSVTSGDKQQFPYLHVYENSADFDFLTLTIPIYTFFKPIEITPEFSILK